MTTINFDTYRAVKDLEAAGLGEKQAAAIVAVVRWAVTGQYASYLKSAPASDVANELETERR